MIRFQKPAQFIGSTLILTYLVLGLTLSQLSANPYLKQSASAAGLYYASIKKLAGIEKEGKRYEPSKLHLTGNSSSLFNYFVGKEYAGNVFKIIFLKQTKILHHRVRPPPNILF